MNTAPKEGTFEGECRTCKSQCQLCSDYLWMIRELGCCAQWSSKKERKACKGTTELKGTACPECGSPANAGKAGVFHFTVKYERGAA